MTTRLRASTFSAMLQVDPVSDRRSWDILAGHPIGEDACGPCRRHGNRSERDSHPGLDGAHNAPPTTAHKAHMSSVDEKKEMRKMARRQSEGGSQDELPSSLRFDE